MAATIGGAGSASFGVSADYRQKYTFTLSYNKYFGSHSVDSSGNVSSFRGLYSLLYDRDWVSFTFKTNF